VTYSYDNAGARLRKMAAGETEMEFNYDEITGLLESVMTRSGHHFDMRTRYKYHGGLTKEMKVRFSGASSPDFDNAIFRYQVMPHIPLDFLKKYSLDLYNALVR
jgi:hypothetical protein